MGDKFLDSMPFVEDAVASLAVPWKWDILHRWKRSRRLGGSGSPATAGLLQMHKTSSEECSLEDRLLIVYDRELCTKEEDDPNDAIVFFHPADESAARKCELSCQLVGVVHFFTSCFDTPRTVELRNSRIAVRALANYVVALGSTKNLADYVLQQQADMLVRLLRFYHKSFPDMKQGCSSTESFAARVREFCNSCLPVCCGPKDQLSNLFMAVPTLKLPDAASGVYTKGFALLEDLQKMPGVLASCVLFDERVLASQFTPEITQLLLLAATSKERLAMQDVPVKYSIPPAVRLVNVYLEAAWLRDLAVINKQSNENPKELDKYVEGPVDDEKRSTGSLHSVQEPDGQHAEKYTPAFEDKDVEREDSLSDDDSTMSSQTTNQSSSYAPLISAVLQATGKQSLPDSDFLSDFDSAEDMDFAGPDACLKRLAELQDTVAECLRISQENLATDTRRRRRAASRKSKKALRKYVSKPDLRRILREIDEAQGQEYEDSRVSAPSYRRDDTNVFQDYDADMGFDTAGLFYQAQAMQTPTLLGHLNQRSKITTQEQATTWQPQSQLLYDLYAKKFQRALTKLGEMCSSLSQSKERSSEKKSLFSSLRKTRETPPGAEVTGPQGLLPQSSGAGGFELPPVVQVELGEALDVPTEESNPVFRKHKTNDSAGDRQPNGASAPARPEHESECLCNAEDYDQHSVLEGVPRTGVQCELRRSTLFIQRYCNMACLVLLSNAAEENEDFIYSLWKRCIGELGDLEVAARSWQHQDHQQINETKCAEVCFNSKLCSLRGSLDTQEDVKKWHLQLIQCAHGEFRRNSYINNINALSLGNTWIHATRSEDYESFKVTTDEHKDVPLATSV